MKTDWRTNIHLANRLKNCLQLVPMKTYSDLAGDGGSNVIGQVLAQRAQIKKNLSRIKQLIAIGSGKGGVGKSTLTMQLAAALQLQGKKVSLLDADINGPSLAKLSGLENTLLVPGKNGLLVPKTKSGIGVLSFGSVVPETESIDFDTVSPADSHIWRATKEFATLAQFLGGTDWGKLDFLLIDLPPGSERVFQFAEFFGSETQFILVTIPSEISQGVVSRSIASLKKTESPLLGLIENMSGYYCSTCNEIKPLFPHLDRLLFDIPLLGRIPFDPRLASYCDRGITIAEFPESAVAKAVFETVKNISMQLEGGLS